MGNMINRGISAYRQTMRQQPPAGEDKKEDFPPAVTKTETSKNDNSLLKTTSLLKKDTAAKQTQFTPSADSKIRRVAKFLILIGSEQAAKILGELDGQQVEEISREIATIRGISENEAESIFAEFQSLLTSHFGYLGPSRGGVETARRILYTAYGPEKGEVLLNNAVPDSKENIFGFLEEFEPEQVVFLLKDESPAAAALVLARLPPKFSAAILKKFSPALKPEILKRIARQSEVSPDVLESVAGAIRDKARHLSSGGSKDITIDGMQTLAAILKQGDYSFGDSIINQLEAEDPDIGKELKDRLYTLDDVIAAFDRPLAEKLKTMTERAIAILLKGRSAEFREKILSNVSSRRRDMIREEGDIMGPVSKRECNEVASDFLAWFRLAREKGELGLASDEDWV